ncbi:MAG TPA: hypothetical protein VM452_08550 [Caulifigura sp.]|jgi:hypothetical protein|nr:hypothetical protein [Caulifigura sp.]
MRKVHFAGVELPDDVREKVIALLAGESRVVVVPAADSRALPNPWLRLPREIAWFIADIYEWAAVASDEPLSRSKGEDPWESDLAMAMENRNVTFLEPAELSASPVLPSLTPRDRPAAVWLLEGVGDRDWISQPVRSETDLTALRAGVLQMADHLTASHEYSQSIEGRGKRQAGDYWHAINHRREPDYGNAKYWFRHVGRHPLLKDLAEVVPALAGEFTDSVQVKAHALIEGGVLDPFRFVDLVSDACRRKDRELVRFAERVQWMEMVGLMERTLEDVTT